MSNSIMSTNLVLKTFDLTQVITIKENTCHLLTSYHLYNGLLYKLKHMKNKRVTFSQAYCIANLIAFYTFFDGSS